MPAPLEDCPPAVVSEPTIGDIAGAIEGLRVALVIMAKTHPKPGVLALALGDAMNRYPDDSYTPEWLDGRQTILESLKRVAERAESDAIYGSKLKDPRL